MTRLTPWVLPNHSNTVYLYTSDAILLLKKSLEVVSVRDLPNGWQDRVHVYFVAIDGDDTAVKIGRTNTTPEDRVLSLQTAHYRDYVVVASIRLPFRAEREIHRALSADRIRGEWFRRSDKVNRLIDLACAGQHFCFMSEIDADVDVKIISLSSFPRSSGA